MCIQSILYKQLLQRPLHSNAAVEGTRDKMGVKCTLKFSNDRSGFLNDTVFIF